MFDYFYGQSGEMFSYFRVLENAGLVERKRHGLGKPNLILSKLVDCLEKCLIYGHIRRVAD